MRVSWAEIRPETLQLLPGYNRGLFFRSARLKHLLASKGTKSVR